MAVKSRQYQYIYRILYEAYDVKGAFALKWTLRRVISDSLNKSGEQSEGGPLTWSAILRSQWQWRWGGGWRSQGWLHIDIGQTLITLYPATAQVLFTSLNISDDHRWTFLVVSLQLDTCVWEHCRTVWPRALHYWTSLMVSLHSVTLGWMMRLWTF